MLESWSHGELTNTNRYTCILHEHVYVLSVMYQNTVVYQILFYFQRNTRDHFFAFEYEYQPQKFMWITLRGWSTILLTQCISKAVEEYIMMASRKEPTLMVTYVLYTMKLLWNLVQGSKHLFFTQITLFSHELTLHFKFKTSFHLKLYYTCNWLSNHVPCSSIHLSELSVILLGLLGLLLCL